MSMRGQIDVVVPQSRRVRAAGDGDVFKQDTRWLAFTQPRTEYRYLQALHTRKHKRITFAATVGALILLLLGFVTPHWTEKAVLAVLVLCGIAIPAACLGSFLLFSGSPHLRGVWSALVAAAVTTAACCSMGTAVYCAHNLSDEFVTDYPACDALDSGFVPVVPLLLAVVPPHMLQPFLAVSWVHASVAAAVMAVSFIAQFAPSGHAVTLAEICVVVCLNAVAVAFVARERDIMRRQAFVAASSTAPTTPAAARHQLTKLPSFRPTYSRNDSAGAAEVLDLVNVSPNLWLTMDVNGVVHWASPAVQEVLGQTRHTVVGQPYENFAMPEDAALIKYRLSEAREHPNTPFTIQFRRPKPSGGSRRVEFTGQFVGQRGALVGIIGVESDLTKKEARLITAAAEVTEGNRSGSRDKVTNYATHTLRNSLHALDAVCTYMAEADLDESQREDLQDLQVASVNIHMLVEDVLVMKGVRDGSLVSYPYCFAVTEWLSDVLGRARSVAKPGVVLKARIDTNLPTHLVMDSHFLGHMLLCIVVNAVQSSPPESEVVVEFARSGETQVTVKVSDSGFGIGSVDVSSLRHALETDNLPTGSRSQRIALFMPICHHLCEALAGTLTVEQSPSSLAFNLALPFGLPSEDDLQMVANGAAGEADVPSELLEAFTGSFVGASTRPASAGAGAGVGAGAGTTTPRGGDSETGTKKRRRGRKGKEKKQPTGLQGYGLLNMYVLLVDDMRMIRRMGANYLEMLGCTFKTLEDGDMVEEALMEAPRPFDAILLDIVMGRSDGAEICNRLRELRGARLPIIAMTSLTDLANRKRFEDMGFDMVLAKPFSKETLGQALVAGRKKRGNTRFKRMSARLDEDKRRLNAGVGGERQRRGSRSGAGDGIPMLPSIPDGEDEDADAHGTDSMLVSGAGVTGEGITATAVAVGGVSDDDDDEDLVMQPSHINAALEAAQNDANAKIVLQP